MYSLLFPKEQFRTDQAHCVRCVLILKPCEFPRKSNPCSSESFALQSFMYSVSIVLCPKSFPSLEKNIFFWIKKSHLSTAEMEPNPLSSPRGLMYECVVNLRKYIISSVNKNINWKSVFQSDLKGYNILFKILHRFQQNKSPSENAQVYLM